MSRQVCTRTNTVAMLCDAKLSRRINGTLVEIYSNEP